VARGLAGISTTATELTGPYVSAHRMEFESARWAWPPSPLRPASRSTWWRSCRCAASPLAVLSRPPKAGGPLPPLTTSAPPSHAGTYPASATEDHLIEPLQVSDGARSGAYRSHIGGGLGAGTSLAVLGHPYFGQGYRSLLILWQARALKHPTSHANISPDSGLQRQSSGSMHGKVMGQVTVAFIRQIPQINPDSFFLLTE